MSRGEPPDPVHATSPLEALRIEELSRARRLLPIVFFLGIAGIATLPLMRGHRWIAAAVCVGISATVAAFAWLNLTIREPEHFTDGRIGIVMAPIIATILLADLYYGIYSPAPVLLGLAIYVTAQGRSLVVSWGVYIACAAGHATLVLLIELGAMDDPGVLRAHGLDRMQRVVGQVLVQGIMVGCLAAARSSRKATILALAKAQGAARAVALRDALLFEARQELRRARQLGDPGRFSDQVLGSFRLGVVLGRGAMGEVYEAEHVESGEPAAVKLLHSSLLGDPAYVARFVREVKIAASLSSPYVVRVLEVGGDEELLPYMAMERLEGHDLRELIDREGIMSATDVAVMVRQVATAIDAANRAGIVHRDLKPRNLFFASGVWKVLDFGVSKMDGTGTLTGAHAVGTPGYMAPEQARGKDVDTRADVYALAAIAYRALTGHPAFSGSDVPRILMAVASEMPIRPSGLADIPVQLDAVLAVGLAKKPDKRFRDAPSLALAFEQALDGALDPAVIARAEALLARKPWRL